MKVSKIFGCVLGLHLCVIAVLLVQPGCRTKQPPTQTYTQERTIKTSVQGASRTSGGLIEATRADSGASGASGLDAAFNAGFESNDFGPGNEFTEFETVEAIEPIAPIRSGGQTVEVAGSSFETYTVKKGDNLWSIARRYNVSLNEIYAANGLNKNSVLSIGQQIQIPVEGGTATVSTVNADTYQPTSFNQGSTSYTVKRGDTLSGIASRFDTSVRAIKATNGKSSDLIRVGETLIIPVSGSTSAAPAPAATTVSPTTSVSFSAPSASGRTHTVRSGEYPATIARKYGMTTGELLALNGITDPRKLQVGQVLKVSGSGSAANIDSRTETVVSPAPAVSSTPATVTTIPAQPATAGIAPVEITVIEADPLVEGEATEIQIDEEFEGAVEIPVIRLEE